MALADLSQDLASVGRSLGLMEASIEVLKLAEKFQNAGKYEAYQAARDLSAALKVRSDDLVAAMRK